MLRRKPIHARPGQGKAKCFPNCSEGIGKTYTAAVRQLFPSCCKWLRNTAYSVRDTSPIMYDITKGVGPGFA